jgi:type IV secretion system protein VirB10
VSFAALGFNQFQAGGQQLGQSTFGDDITIPPTLSTPQARTLVVMAMRAHVASARRRVMVVI